MQFRNLRIVALFVMVTTLMAKGAEPIVDQSASAELNDIGKQVEKDVSNWRDAIARLNDGGNADFNAVLEVSRKRSPMAVHGPQLIEFAKKYPGTHESLCALVHLIQYADADPGDPAFRYAEAAIELLGQNEVNNDLFPAAAKELRNSVSQKAESALRNVARQSNDRLVCAAATLALVEYLYGLTQASDLLNEEPTGRNRDWVKNTLQPAIVKRLANRKPDQLRNEAIELAERLHKEYSEFQQPEIRYAGPNQILIEFTQRKKPLTYGELAAALLFEMRHLQVGQQVPDIVGKDTKGREFRLSDFRNKVVVLTFSANWCEPCVAAYPQNRKLVERFKGRPFSLVSVVADEAPSTVDEAIAKGAITWRCWYDGMDGPIARRWNIHGWPTVCVIDAAGIIRHRNPADDKLDQLVETLVRKAERQRE